MAAPIKLGFKLGKPGAALPKPSASRAAFGDDEDAPAAPPVASTSKGRPPASKAAPSQTGLSRQQKATLAEAQQLDAMAFEYDSIYDSMQTAKLAAQATRKAESLDKKVRARITRCLTCGLRCASAPDPLPSRC